MAKCLNLAVAILCNADGQVLLVRKRGTAAFMQPGGKIDAGETPPQALCRELKEELRLDLREGDLTWVTRCTAPAANERDTKVRAEVFRVALPGTDDLRPEAEIAEARWVSPTDRLPLAPLTRDHILPLVWTAAA